MTPPPGIYSSDPMSEINRTTPTKISFYIYLYVYGGSQRILLHKSEIRHLFPKQALAQNCMKLFPPEKCENMFSEIGCSLTGLHILSIAKTKLHLSSLKGQQIKAYSFSIRMTPAPMPFFV